MSEKKSLLEGKGSGQISSFEELRTLGVDTKFDAKIPVPAAIFHSLSTLLGNRMQEGTELKYEQVVTPTEEEGKVNVQYVEKLLMSEEAMACNRIMAGLQACMVDFYNESPDMFMTREEAAKLREAAIKASQESK